jgi:hypothetical protein
MSKAEKKIQTAFEAGKAYILANRHEKAVETIVRQPLPRKRYGRRINGVKRVIRGGLATYSKAEKFELLHFAAGMKVRETRARFEDALSKLNKEEAAVLASQLETVRV